VNLKEKFNGVVAKDKLVTKGYNEIMHGCLNIVLQKMKDTDETFKKYYTETFFGGSYFDKLAVGNVRHEFDCNLLYSVPEDGFEIKENQGSNFMEFSTRNRHTERFSEIVDNDKISPEKMKAILKTAGDRALTELNHKVSLPNVGDVSVTRRDKLPYTLLLQAESGEFRNKVEVDLVPAIHISNHKLPQTTAENIKSLQEDLGTSEDKFLANAMPIVSKDKLAVDFPKISRESFRGKPAARMAVRMLKEERNEKGGPMEKIWSHGIKIAAVHEIRKNPDPQHWHEARLGPRLEDIRTSLQKYLENGEMVDPYFPTINMMERVKSTNVKQCNARYLERSMKNMNLGGKDFPCASGECNRMFKTDKAAQHHSGDRHKAGVERSAKETETREAESMQKETRERTVPCALGLCNRKLIDKKGSVQHAVSSHREEADEKEIWRKFLREDEGKIPCGFCNCASGFVRGFVTRQGYNDHARAMNH